MSGRSHSEGQPFASQDGPFDVRLAYPLLVEAARFAYTADDPRARQKFLHAAELAWQEIELEGEDT